MTKQVNPTKVEIYTQHQYDMWLASKPDFSVITTVRLYNLPGVTALPDLAAATDVWLYNLPGVTALPDLAAATDVWLDNNLKKLRK